MSNPRINHWDAALHVVRYLNNSPGQGILLDANTELRLSVRCDADWGACPITSRSLCCWFIQLGGSPLSMEKDETR